MFLMNVTPSILPIKDQGLNELSGDALPRHRSSPSVNPASPGGDKESFSYPARTDSLNASTVSFLDRPSRF